MAKKFKRVAQLKDAQTFGSYLEELGIELGFEEAVLAGADSPLGQPYSLKSGKVIGNRFSILPMEGWDGTADGNPSELTARRWENFGRSGAKLIWGGEAVAVRHDGRANPNQLMIQPHTLKGLATLRERLLKIHKDMYGQTDDLVVGLQLTHSGRFARPNEKTRLEPKIAYHHPVLEEIYNVDPDLPVLTDGEVEGLVEAYHTAARNAQALGFDFVDIKHSHGYLGHEFLSAYSRPGKYGGSFENRTRFLREIVAGIREEASSLEIGTRVSAFDFPPFRPGEEEVGEPKLYLDEEGQYPFAFCGDPEHPLEIKNDEMFLLMDLLQSLGIQLVNFSAGSPYYNPHILRPAYFPPSDGYQPPEDPLVGVARQINNTAIIKARFPEMTVVGSAYSYLQEWVPNVGQYVVRNGLADLIGLGRMVLSYPEMPADILAGKMLARKRICRTFSDCTTAPRKGMISGCFPLDEYFKQRPEAEKLKEIKANL